MWGLVAMQWQSKTTRSVVAVGASAAWSLVGAVSAMPLNAIGDEVSGHQLGKMKVRKLPSKWPAK